MNRHISDYISKAGALAISTATIYAMYASGYAQHLADLDYSLKSVGTNFGKELFHPVRTFSVATGASIITGILAHTGLEKLIK